MTAMDRQSYSIVEYFVEHKSYKCGYCKNPDTNYSHGMWAHSLTVQDYQSLIDRGWRRSGCYCYKSMMNQTCCPLYTIKCEALDFRISKSQKKILKRMVKFLRNELTNDNSTDANEVQCDNMDISIEEESKYAKHLAAKAQKHVFEIDVMSVDKLNGRLSVDSVQAPKGSQISQNSTSVLNSQKELTTADSTSKPHLTKSEVTSAVPRKKAKLLRVERKRSKLLAQGKTQSEIEKILKEKKPQNCAKSLEELFDEVYTGLKKLELKLVRTAPMSSEYLKTSKQSYEVYKKYQTTIHGVSTEKVTEQQYTRFLVRSPLQMRLVRVTSDECFNTLDASASLYKKYQIAIHGDSPEECDRKSFFDFLVKSPLQQWMPNNGGPPQGYGSFHEQYWLNNELIAVGVIDILPSCISSVYFFYDPSYSQLSLGTFSSLREIYLTRQFNQVTSDLKYYYMGFYIHTCPKMRYKARMQPSKLLCPETYAWFDIEPCLAKLDMEKYSRLNDDIDAIDENSANDSAIQEIRILYNRTAMLYKIYRTRIPQQMLRKEDREIKEYANLVGMQCARKMLLCRS